MDLGEIKSVIDHELKSLSEILDVGKILAVAAKKIDDCLDVKKCQPLLISPSQHFGLVARDEGGVEVNWWNSLINSLLVNEMTSFGMRPEPLKTLEHLVLGNLSSNDTSVNSDVPLDASIGDKKIKGNNLQNRKGPSRSLGSLVGIRKSVRTRSSDQRAKIENLDIQKTKIDQIRKKPDIDGLMKLVDGSRGMLLITPSHPAVKHLTLGPEIGKLLGSLLEIRNYLSIPSDDPLLQMGIGPIVWLGKERLDNGFPVTVADGADEVLDLGHFWIFFFTRGRFEGKRKKMCMLGPFLDWDNKNKNF